VKSKAGMKVAIKTANVFLLLGITALFLLLNVPFRGARGREEPPQNVSHDFRRGDSNEDGKVDIADVVFALSFLFLGGEKPPCLAAADANDDGQLDIADGVYVLAFLFMGGADPRPPFPDRGLDPTPDLGCHEPPLPGLLPVGSLGGPDRQLTTDEALSFRRGLQVFDRPTTIAQGLGPNFNGDSCRACHSDPVLGGAGGLDVNVVRFAHVDETGVVSQLPGGPAASRQAIPQVMREECPDAANVIETRQTPTILGLGLVDRIPDSVILSHADPDDADGDGIRGRARFVDGRLGRFGHKCGVPSLADFAADALFNELGVTVSADLSPFAVAADGDAVADPEMPDQDFKDQLFFISHLAPPPRSLPSDPLSLSRVHDGEAIFHSLGCASCHLPSLEGPDGPVRAFSDFLLHQVGDPDRLQVNEPGVEPREFRTAPLWGLRDTPPYLHDGSAESIPDAVLLGHFGEAKPARTGFQALSGDDQAKLVEFLTSL
jgi:hypothetical protein